MAKRKSRTSSSSSSTSSSSSDGGGSSYRNVMLNVHQGIERCKTCGRVIKDDYYIILNNHWIFCHSGCVLKWQNKQFKDRNNLFWQESSKNYKLQQQYDELKEQKKVDDKANKQAIKKLEKKVESLKKRIGNIKLTRSELLDLKK